MVGKIMTFEKYACYKIISLLIQLWSLILQEMLGGATALWIKHLVAFSGMASAISSVRDF